MGLDHELDGTAPPPEPKPPAPPTIVRRVHWRSARDFFLVVVPLGVVLTALASLHWAFLPFGLLVLAGTGVIGLATARARTEIGPDGVRNRALRKEVFIPWEDITDVEGMETRPRVIRVVRASGKRVTLAATSDDGTAPGGIGFDDLVDLVRERAGLMPQDDAEAAETAATVEPLSLRPSRGPLLWLVPLMAALVYVYVEFARDLFVFGYLLAIPFLQAALVLKLLLGRTEADAKGLRNRLMFRTRTVPWSDVTEISVIAALFGKAVQVTDKNNKRFMLAAPRHTLLGRDLEFDATLQAMRALARPHRVAMPAPFIRATRIMWWVLLSCAVGLAVAFGKPWLEPWWPGRVEAESLPRACAIADQATLQRLVPKAKPLTDTSSSSTYSAASRCTLYNDDGASLSIDLELQRRDIFTDATKQAREVFAREREMATKSSRSLRSTVPTPVPGLGDEAIWETKTDEGDTEVAFLIRRANVVIELNYEAKRPADQVRADATALARTTLAQLKL